jgi:hypothetical protein
VDDNFSETPTYLFTLTEEAEDEIVNHLTCIMITVL